MCWVGERRERESCFESSVQSFGLSSSKISAKKYQQEVEAGPKTFVSSEIRVGKQVDDAYSFGKWLNYGTEYHEKFLILSKSTSTMASFQQIRMPST